MKTNNPSIKTDLTDRFEEYMRECKYCSHLSAETMRGFSEFLSLFLKLMPEITDMDLLTPQMLVEFFRRIETRDRIVGKTIKQGVKNSTIKTQWSKLNVFFAWLVRKGYVQENPLKGIKPPNPNYDDPQALNDREIHKLYAAIILRSGNSLILRRDTMIVSLLLYCGLRKGELISLQVRDIDLEKREIMVRSETSKSRNWRVLKIHPTLLMHLKDYFKERKHNGLKTEHLIVASKGDRGLTREGVKHWVSALKEKSGVRFHLHQLRHTFACKLAEADVHPFKIQKMMGHTSPAMTMKYVRSMKTENMENDIGKIAI